MKLFFVYITTLILLISCNNDTNGKSITQSKTLTDSLVENISIIDSVEIIDDIAEWPFLDSIINSAFFENKINNKLKITTKLAQNIHDPAIIDTIRIIEWDSSYVETLSNVYTKSEYLQTSRIADESIQFKKNLKVGISEETVFKTFGKVYDKTKTYKYFLITYGDGAENYLFFIFENRAVKYISFQPYTG